MDEQLIIASYAHSAISLDNDLLSALNTLIAIFLRVKATAEKLG